MPESFVRTGLKGGATSEGLVLTGTYDYRLVALSVWFAMLASYAALDLTGRVTAARRGLRIIWLAGGAIVMGLGIWAMHYIAMLAFTLPVPVLYHYPTVLVSLLAAISRFACSPVYRQSGKHARLATDCRRYGDG